MKVIAILLFTLFFGQIVFSQEAPIIKRTVLKKSYVGLAFARNGFQDAKFSNIQYYGSLMNLSLGTSRENEQYFWKINFSGDYSSLKTKFHQYRGIFIHSKLDFTYSKKIFSHFLIGGKWTLADIYFIRFADLGNNSLNFVSNSRLSFFGKYEHKINDDLTATFSLSVGLLGMIKEFKSFAYSAPQNILEDGKFDFQDDGTQNPFSLKYYRFRTIGKLNSFEMKTELEYKKRWSFFYHWNMLNYITVKRYPLTLSQHIIGVRFNFIHKTKERISKK